MLNSKVPILFVSFVVAIQLSSIYLDIRQVQATAQVGTSNIANNAVTSPKIRDGEVKTPDIANDAITTSKISEGAIEASDLAENSVTTGNIQDGSITAADLSTSAAGSVGALEKLTDVSDIIFDSCSIDFSSIPAQQDAFAFCPVVGAGIDDKIIITNQDMSSGVLTQSASVNATDLVRITVRNANFIAADPPQMSWAMIIFRS